MVVGPAIRATRPPSSGAVPTTDAPSASDGLPGVDAGSLLDGSGDYGVPERMSEWSWTLYYLRGIQ